ncbi:hypothetical protein EDC94DRAFT_617765 [Helicostylum pulchrum]|uniref:XRCC4 n=1 Tax=Helicostylum pulchrum TaxID=562976 RepID=A0ABP9XPF7_9FUNG|nr:hypothetical protein EDC94DRAFT_617765 [Helicostylum pulchrum]
MNYLFYFYEAIQDDEKDTVPETQEPYYVQCQWFNETLDLDQETTENPDYCLLTVTDLANYWQITITRDMLIEKFPPSNCLIHKFRNKVLRLSLQGSQWIHGHQIQWAIVIKNDDQIEMKLRVHYFDSIYGIAGSVNMDKLSDERKSELNKAWYKNSAIASRKSNETEEALNIRHKDIQDINQKLRDALESLKKESIESRLTLFSNFSKVLNAKKERIVELACQVDYLNKRKREDNDEDNDDTRSRKKISSAQIEESFPQVVEPIQQSQTNLIKQEELSQSQFSQSSQSSHIPKNIINLSMSDSEEEYNDEEEEEEDEFEALFNKSKTKKFDF